MIPSYGLAGSLQADLNALGRLRAAGHLVGLRPLEALVAIRRARGYGDGPSAMRHELERLEREREAEKTSGPIQGEHDSCPSCRASMWRPTAPGLLECDGCGFRGELPTRSAR